MSGRWRVGRKLGRTIYVNDECIGMLDTQAAAQVIVDTMNERELPPDPRIPTPEDKPMTPRDWGEVMRERLAAISVDFQRGVKLRRILRRHPIAMIPTPLDPGDVQAMVKWLLRAMGHDIAVTSRRRPEDGKIEVIIQPEGV